MAKKRVSIVKTKTNGDIEYKVLNAIDSDMGWLKWSIIILFTAVLCPVFLKSLGVAAVEIVAGILAAIGIAIFVCLVLKGHFLGNAEAKLVESAIKEVVVRDAERLQQKVVKVKFCSDSLDSYGTIDVELVNTLGVKISQKNGKDGKVLGVYDQNFEPQAGKKDMLVRIIDNLPPGEYAIEAGFVLKEDKDKKYPAFNRQKFVYRK